MKRPTTATARTEETAGNSVPFSGTPSGATISTSCAEDGTAGLQPTVSIAAITVAAARRATPPRAIPIAAGIDAFAAEYDAKYPKAVTSLRRDQAQLLTFYDYPAEHWRHLRTTNIIESPFATVRLPQRVTKGAGSRTKALMMAFKLLAMAEERWRKVNGSALLPLVRAGV